MYDYSQDKTFCGSDCMNTTCPRHKTHINWDHPKNKYYGASMADFSKDCKRYIGDISK